MNFNIVEFIRQKKAKFVHSQSDLEQFIDLVQTKKVADYQITAWLMAACLNGLNDDETYYLTQAMLKSSKTYDFTNAEKIVIDKHSTGGIGDKVSLILLPILAACGLHIAKLSGKGLGFTGGTIDKLNGLNVKTDYPINTEQILQKLDQEKIVVLEQTHDIVPVDKILYSLRDVTGTVDSNELIVASVLSKKLAFHSNYLFLDIKYGSGSFCKTLEQAKKLANTMQLVADKTHLNLHLHISSMHQPLGRSVGNLIEIQEAYDFLNKFDFDKELYELIKTFAIDILVTTKLALNNEAAQSLFESVLYSKKAFEVMTQWLINNGASFVHWTNNTFFQPQYKLDLVAINDGYLQVVANDQIGIVSNALGAGRSSVHDMIDYHAGIEFHKKNNDKVQVGDKIATLYSSKPIEFDLLKQLSNAFSYSSEVQEYEPLIFKYGQ